MINVEHFWPNKDQNTQQQVEAYLLHALSGISFLVINSQLLQHILKSSGTTKMYIHHTTVTFLNHFSLQLKITNFLMSLFEPSL